MSYERKFCGLSEYVRLQNVRPLIKYIDRSESESTETRNANRLITFTERGTNNLRRPRFLTSGLKASDINDMNWWDPILPRSTESHLDRSIYFFSDLTFWNGTYWKPIKFLFIWHITRQFSLSIDWAFL